MKSKRTLQLALALAVVGAPCAAQALTPAEVFAKVAPSVWVVKALQDDPKHGVMGTAVVLGPRTLVTACHVVRSSASVSVTHSGSQKIYPIAQITPDPAVKRDLCILTTTEDIGAPPVEVAPNNSVSVGDKVFAIGAPLGLELTLSDGLVSSLRASPDEVLPIIQSSAPVAPGSSGGGLFDAEGRLVGLTVSTAGVGTATLNFSDPAAWALEVPARLSAARDAWRKQIAALGVPIGPDGDAAPSGYAVIADIGKVPTAGLPPKGVAQAYQQFLLLAKPRAFIIISDHSWGAITDPSALAGQFADCRARHIQCRLYAVDDAVVWKP
jgi:serine protease Do